jgi:hypothetical protein
VVRHPLTISCFDELMIKANPLQLLFRTSPSTCPWRRDKDPFRRIQSGMPRPITATLFKRSGKDGSIVTDFGIALDDLGRYCETIDG